MFQRDSLYLFVNAAAPVFSIAGIFAFAAGSFALTWSCALGVVACMETRVQTGGRLPHTTLFWIHLLSAIPFFLLLTLLAFFAHSIWLVSTVATLGLVALCSGSVLWYQGLKRRVLHLF